MDRPILTRVGVNRHLLCRIVFPVCEISMETLLTLIVAARYPRTEGKEAGAMRVLVGVKRVVDYAVKVRIQPDKAGAGLLRPFATATKLQIPPAFPYSSMVQQGKRQSIATSMKHLYQSCRVDAISPSSSTRSGAVYTPAVR